MSKNYKSKAQRSLLVLIPWWLYSSGAILLYYFFKYEVHDFYIPNPEHSPMVAGVNSLLHAKIGLYLSYILEFVLAVASLKSFVFSYSKKRFLAKKRNIDALKSMPWQEFEMLVAAAYRKLGYQVEETGLGGADGGVDLVMFDGKEKTIVQCKRWGSTSIGAPVVREMYGLMAHHNADSVKIVCVGKFTKEAHNFAEGKPIELVSGDAFLAMLKKM